MSPDSPDLAALVRRVNDALAQVDHSLRNLEQVRKDLEQSREVIADILGGFLGEKPPPLDWDRRDDYDAYPHWAPALSSSSPDWFTYPYGNVRPCPTCGGYRHRVADLSNDGVVGRLMAVCESCGCVIPRK